jgi:hypothetical protein
MTMLVIYAPIMYHLRQVYSLKFIPVIVVIYIAIILLTLAYLPMIADGALA